MDASSSSSSFELCETSSNSSDPMVKDKSKDKKEVKKEGLTIPGVEVVKPVPATNLSVYTDRKSLLPIQEERELLTPSE